MSKDVITKSEEIIKDDSSEKYLIFFLDDQQFAFHGEDVIEIIGMQAYTLIPNLPDYIKGVVNIRGKIIPLIDLKARLGKPTGSYSDRTCIILVEVNEMSAGFIVDMVKDVSNISEDQMESSSQDETNPTNYITKFCKLDKDVILLLDAKKLLSDATF